MATVTKEGGTLRTVNYPPSKVMAHYGVSVESQWAEGRQASAVTLAAVVAVGQLLYKS